MYEAKTLSYLIGSQAPLPSTTSVGSEVHDVTGSPSPNFSMTSSDVADALNDVYFWVILAFGFPGNLLAFGTILTMKPRLRFTVYVAALALVDNVCLAIKVVYFNLNSYQVDIGDVGCQLMQYFGTFTGQWANWLLVMMTTERLVDFTMPLLSRRINKRHYLIINAIIIALLLGVNGTSFKIYYFDRETRKCSDSYTRESTMYDFVYINAIVEMVVYSLLPVLCLSIMSCLIIRRLYTSVNNIERRFSIQMPALIKRKRYNQNITVTTIVACVIFSLLVTPRPLYYFVEMKWDEVKQKSYSRLLEQIFFAMSDSCHAVNFYIYFLSNRLFRRRLLELAKKAFMYISDFLQVKCHGLTRQNTLGSVMEVWTIEQGTYTRRNSQQQETYTRRNSQQQGTYTRRNSQQQGTYTRRNSQQQGTYTRRNSQQQGTYTRRNSQL